MGTEVGRRTTRTAEDAKDQDFDTRMPSKLSELHTVYLDKTRTLAGVVRPYFPGHVYSEVTYEEYGDPANDSIMGRPADSWSYPTFRRDMGALHHDLADSLNAGDPKVFTDISDLIEEAIDQLGQAKGDGSMESVRDVLNHWHGGAASQFGNVVLDPFDNTCAKQAKYAQELGAAARAAGEVLRRARANYLVTTQQVIGKLQGKVDDDGGASETVWLIGAMAAGIGTFGIGGVPLAAIAWAGATAFHVYDGLDSNKGDEGDGDAKPPIAGTMATDFVQAARDRKDDIFADASGEVARIASGLYADQAKPVPTLQRPDVMDVDSVDGLGPRDGADQDAFSVGNIAELKKAGTTYLPNTAQYLDNAADKLQQAWNLLGPAFGNEQIVACGLKGIMSQMFGQLHKAIGESRDYLYLSGRNLAKVADTYYEDDNHGRTRMNAIYTGSLKGYKGDRYTEDEYREDHPGETGGDIGVSTGSGQ